MCEPRHSFFPAERLVKHVMQRQGWEPFLTANDFGDLHQMIIHDIGQMVCRQFIGSFPKNFIVKSVSINLYMPTNQVIHLNDGV